MTTFRAIWPITDQKATFLDLCRQAYDEVGQLLRQAHARPTGHGRFSVAASAHIPGSGRVTDWVLLYECPAQRAALRALPTIPAAVASTPAAAGPRPAAGVDGEVALQPATSTQAGETAA